MYWGSRGMVKNYNNKYIGLDTYSSKVAFLKNQMHMKLRHYFNNMNVSRLFTWNPKQLLGVSWHGKNLK